MASFSFEAQERVALTAPLELQIDNASGRCWSALDQPASSRRGCEVVHLSNAGGGAPPFAARSRSVTRQGDAIRIIDKPGSLTVMTRWVSRPPRSQVRRTRRYASRASTAEWRSPTWPRQRCTALTSQSRSRNLGEVRLETRHAQVLVSNVEGPLSLDSRHGDVEVSDLARPRP